MRMLLTVVVAWAAISFLFTWRWGSAISSVGDPADADTPLTPGQPAT